MDLSVTHLKRLKEALIPSSGNHFDNLMCYMALNDVRCPIIRRIKVALIVGNGYLA
jgi:hypothetical protein